MGRLKKVGASVYLVAGALVLCSFIGSLAGPFAPRFAELLELPAYQVLMVVCAGVCVLQMLYVLGCILFDRPEPRCVHPLGTPDFEVTIPALESVARTAAQQDDVLVDRVQVRIRGREANAVHITIEAIALGEEGLDVIAESMRRRVERALRDTLGASCSSVRIRFLPTRTTVATKEVQP